MSSVPDHSNAREAIKQAKPFRSSGQEALVNLLLTTETVRWSIADLLARRSDGLTVPQYNVLRVLRGAGRQGLPTLEIADRLMERTPGITRMLDRMEGKGWVERERSVDDRRQVYCRLTAAGAALVRALDRPMDDLDERLFGALNRTELRQLIRLLDKVRNSLGRSR